MRYLLYPVIWLLAVAALSAAVAAVAGWNFWWVLGVTAVAILANGLLATLEDDLPGGFANPDGKSTPKYVAVARWVVRGLCVLAGALVIGMLALHFLGTR